MYTYTYVCKCVREMHVKFKLAIFIRNVYISPLKQKWNFQKKKHQNQTPKNEKTPTKKKNNTCVL